jgi:DNA-binding transcriptional MocR family regulator
MKSRESEAGTPASIQELVNRLKREIEDGTRVPGSRLPSIRTYAKSQGASRYAVVEAFDRLAGEGFIFSRPGSGFYVALNRKRAHAKEPPQDRSFSVAWLIRDFLEAPSGVLKVGGPWLPDAWLEVEAIQRVVRSLGRGPASHLLKYGSPKGYLPLRENLQAMLQDTGVQADVGQIMTTTGTSQALDLVIRGLIKPGDTVLVEDPGYYNLFGYLRLCGARLIGVPRRPDGPDVEILRAMAERHRPKLMFMQTALQSPTASDTSAHNMHRILQIATEFDFRIVEDDTYGDIAATPGPRLATLDQLDRVIYVRSFSKSLSGSIRVGFIAASPELIEELTNIKVLSSIATSEFNERFIHLMLIEGHYRKFVDRVRRKLSQARASAIQLLGGVGLEVFTIPTAGNFLWARYPEIEDSAEIALAARSENIILGVGAVFRPNLEPSPYMRFNVTLCDDSRLERFLRRYREGREITNATLPPGHAMRRPNDLYVP